MGEGFDESGLSRLKTGELMVHGFIFGLWGSVCRRRSSYSWPEVWMSCGLSRTAGHWTGHNVKESYHVSPGLHSETGALSFEASSYTVGSSQSSGPILVRLKVLGYFKSQPTRPLLTRIQPWYLRAPGNAYKGVTKDYSALFPKIL